MTDNDKNIAYNIVRKYINLGVKFIVGKDVYAEWLKKDIIEAMTTSRNEEKEKVAALMIRTSIATGHGDTIDDLLHELEASILELQKYRIIAHQKQEALEVLFDLLERNGIDYSHLIP